MEPARTANHPLAQAAPRLVWTALAVILVLVVGAGIVSIVRRDRGAASLVRLDDLGTVPDFRLIERDGRTVGLTDLRGRLWVADFVFTRCAGVCPVLSSRMAELQAALAVSGDSDVRLVSFSVDPAHDTPEILRGYAERHRAGAGWWFLTGERQSLYDLIKNGFRLSVAESEPGAAADPNEMITHSDRFVLVDGEAKIRGYYHGTEPDSVRQLVDDVGALRRANR